MKDTWHNNRISKKLNEEYPRYFSICDIDGAVRCNYFNQEKCRFIIYESKNENETLSPTQLETLKLLNENINWNSNCFDNSSGVYIIKIIDIDKYLEWYDLNDNLIKTTTFKQLYKIFSNKIEL